jgi:hypothetical protein
MHIAQPIIAAWSLRRWPRASALAFAYCALLVPCILILEWHYFVDILSGMPLRRARCGRSGGFSASGMLGWDTHLTSGTRMRSTLWKSRGPVRSHRANDPLRYTV